MTSLIAFLFTVLVIVSSVHCRMTTASTPGINCFFLLLISPLWTRFCFVFN